MSASRETVAACLIVRDEQERLGAALESVSFCDEVIVVDSGSRDRTMDVARNAGATVIEHPWSGFGAQRNVAIDAATTDWILEVDADERITPPLKDELLRFLGAPESDVAIGALPMREWFLGRLLGPAIKYPRYRTRLFRRGAYRHDERRRVHEGIWPCGRTWAARADMHHILASSLREAMADWWRYSRLEADQAPPLRGLGAYVQAIVVRPAAKLFYRTVVDQAWRDGAPGLLKVGLDCSHDIMVRIWQLRSSAARDGDREAAASTTFGRVERRCGPVRLVALVSGEDPTRSVIDWLARARGAGADVALVTDRDPPTDAPWLSVQTVPRLGVLAVLRALDATAQLRPYDALVVGSERAARTAARLPRRARGSLAPQRVDGDPVKAVAAITAQARPQGAESAPGVRSEAHLRC